MGCGWGAGAHLVKEDFGPFAGRGEGRFGAGQASPNHVDFFHELGVAARPRR